MLPTNRFMPKLLAVAVASAAAPALALDLEEVIVTGVVGESTALEATVSVSNLNSDEIINTAPRNSAEILRSIPGIRVEASGGEGNANIGVRGLPMPDGGARYVQVQEDGLPIMMFGDINFGNPDIFFRLDRTINNIESVRGGSAATLVSNGPGGIINFLSKTGEEDGGSFAITYGLDYGEQRADFEVGGRLNDTTRYHIGGFFRQGEGPRDTGYNAYDGGQIKANLTKEFDNGFVRVYYKHLEDKAAAILPHAGSYDNDDLDNFDVNNDATQSAYLISTQHLTPEGDLLQRDVRDGQHPIVESWGAEFEFDLGDGWSVSNKFRKTEITGSWTGPYVQGQYTSGAEAAADWNGDYLAYANGPSAGEQYDGLVNRLFIFDVTYDDMGNYFNDLRVTKEFNESITLTAGIFNGVQAVDQQWQWSTYLQEVKGDNAALLNVIDDNGSPADTSDDISLSQNGLARYGVAWGDVQRDWDSEFEVIAPYVALNAVFGDFTLDVSVRQDEGRGTGVRYQGDGSNKVVDVNGNGVIDGQIESTVNQVNYDAPLIANWEYSETSFSIGGNYVITDGLAIFANISEGKRANADRKVGAGDATSSGDVPDEELVDEVEQAELGVKWSTDSFDLFATLFSAETALSSVDFTQTPSQIDTVYEITGIEIEGEYSVGNFVLNGNVTYTDAEITENSGVSSDITPRRQPDFIYSLRASYETDRFGLGGNIIGATDAFYNNEDNNTPGEGDKIPSFNTVTLYGNYYVTDNFSLSLNINNVFDEIVITEAGQNADESAGIRGFRAANGRTTSISAAFTF